MSSQTSEDLINEPNDESDLEVKIESLADRPIEVPLGILSYVRLCRESKESKESKEPRPPSPQGAPVLAIALADASLISSERGLALEKCLRDHCTQWVRKNYDLILKPWCRERLTYHDANVVLNFIREQMRALTHTDPPHPPHQNQNYDNNRRFPAVALDELVAKGVEYGMLEDLEHHWSYQSEADFYLAHNYTNSGHQPTQSAGLYEESDEDEGLYEESEEEPAPKIQRIKSWW